ncbi:MFS transporter [Pusillimonas sp. TS35]|uniref:MFS transporter n=1 Tax=Paracandidimonas lactea TaxID=2895524 RepID=UPI00136A527D|nr:MFS transporter [Paracandidimonas lactea]MYN12495.1 MFS transporter [Pusillimonas sp. TS35]
MAATPSPSITADADPQAHVARRNIRLLFTAQALGGSAPPIIISLGGIVGQQLAGDPALATLPVSLYYLGLAMFTIPAALLARRLGRRLSYAGGAALSIVAGLVAAYGIVSGQFLMFCLSTLLAGYYGACVQNYRFAASDSVTAPERPKAIARIMAGGLVAAVIGPQVVIWTRDAWPGAPFAGSFLGMTALALLAMPILLSLHTPPPAAAAVHEDAQTRSLWEIAGNPRFAVAAIAGIISYGLMSFVMTAAPMAMVHHGHSVGEAALGIQWHVLAMYGPSFFTGHLITRFGKITITTLGLLMIAAAAALALTGLGLFHFWGMLILLGLGWNFGFIGATALVTDTYRPAERGKVQALNDFLIFGTVAIASFSSGQLLNAAGWGRINGLILPVIAAVLVLLAWLALSNRRSARA